MLSHSPPIFSHSPPISFLSGFMKNNTQSLSYSDEHNKASKYSFPEVITLASKAIVNNASNFGQLRTITPHSRPAKGSLERISSAPNLQTNKKSCLAPKSCLCKKNNSVSLTNQESAVGKKSQPRKKVIFADDEGLSLTEIRIMSEPSNVPPLWSKTFLEQITKGLVCLHPADQWTVDFIQPASDYLSFRQKIENDFVSLENVIVKDEESIVLGTVKVKNISFEKEVIVRVTWDNWKSQQDIYCTFSRAYGPATCSHVVFDTFSFKIILPPSSKKLEFCVCYRANGENYWDNNNGKNFTISKKSSFYYNALSPYDKSPSRHQCHDMMRASIIETFDDKVDDQSTDSSKKPYW